MEMRAPGLLRLAEPLMAAIQRRDLEPNPGTQKNLFEAEGGMMPGPRRSARLKGRRLPGRVSSRACERGASGSGTFRSSMAR